MAEDLVYFITDGDFTKIGVSNDPKKRLANLQTSNPKRLHLIGTLRGGYSLEKRLHAHFAERRVSGEWFKLEEADIKPFFEAPPEEQERRRKPPLAWTAELLDGLAERFPADVLPFFYGASYGIVGMPVLEAGVQRTLRFLSWQEDLQGQYEVLLLAVVLDALRADRRATYLAKTRERLEERMVAREALQDLEAVETGASLRGLAGSHRCRRYLPLVDLELLLEKHEQVWYSPELCLLAMQRAFSRLSGVTLTAPDDCLETPAQEG